MAARDTFISQKTMPLESLREEHLAEGEIIAFSRQVLSAEERDEARAHLDLCKRCRDRLEQLHQEDDGTGSTKLSDPLLGRMLGEYQVEQALSRGGMGAVYKGRQPVIGKKVAIKLLLPDIAGDLTQVHRLLEEARAVNAIRHPNIIDIFSFGDLPDGRHYFVMELLEGKPLDELLAHKGRLTPSEVMTVLEQTMSALGAAHGAGIIHRDLKPANLFVSTLPDQSWHVTVLDFGLAKNLGAKTSGTMPNMVMGTPGYMAPEQIRGLELSPQTDLYAMGVVAWVLLTGREPFDGPSLMDVLSKHLEAPLPELAPLVPGCPPSLARLVTRLLSKAPAERPGSAMEVLAELQRIRHERASKPQPLVQPPRVRPSAPRPPKPPPEPTLRLERAAAPAPLAADTTANPALRRPARWPLAAAAALLVVAGLGGVAWGLRGDSGSGPPPGGDPTGEPSKPAEPPRPVVEPPVAATPATTDAPSAPEVPVVTPSPPAATDAPTQPEVPPAPPVATEALTPAPTPRPVAAPAGPTRATVEKRLAAAHQKAAALESPAARRMMGAQLDELERRLRGGAAPRAVNQELGELLETFGAR